VQFISNVRLSHLRIPELQDEDNAINVDNCNFDSNYISIMVKELCTEHFKSDELVFFVKKITTGKEYNHVFLK
jgi:hypothetical protein